MLSQGTGVPGCPATTSTSFSRLPLELRRKIVRIAALETLIVLADVGRTKDKGRDLGTALLVPIRPSTPLLRVREAREECQVVLTAHREPQSGEPKLYFNEAGGVLWLTIFYEWTPKHEKFAGLVPKTNNG